uniref:Glycoprotein B n=2 Tax=Equid gammaherpesvirus 2 TaxID=12657 RepID=F2WU36_9GAMA|nr:glycoprotein B [Equid gammaherpesvirus 2]
MGVGGGPRVVLCLWWVTAMLFRVVTNDDQTTPFATDRPEVSGAENSTNPFLPFRVCGASPTGGEIFRFPLEEKCPNTEDKDHIEGIALIYKTNIVPYIFKVRKYRKIMTSTTIYKGWSEDAITNQHTRSYGVYPWEARMMDYYYQCFNAIQVNEGGHINTYVDRDGWNETAFLKPADGLTTNIRRFQSQPEVYAIPRNLLWSYTTRTTVNCEVTDMTARSIKPFDFFVTSVGDTIEMSPFVNNVTHDTKPASTIKKPVSLDVLRNYAITTYGQGVFSGENATRLYATFNDFSLSWKAETENSSYCHLVLWRGVPNAIQTQHDNSYQFSYNDITAAFTTPLTEETSEFNKTYQCVWKDIEGEIDKKLQTLTKTHAKNGSFQIYKTSGNLYIVWQPLVQLNLLYAHARALNATNHTETTTPTPTSTSSSHRRKRRSAETGAGGGNGTGNYTLEGSVAASQLQFAYDNLRKSINRVLEELSRAWCREQYRSSLIWYELSKINPTSVMSAIYGRPVSAKLIGDVVSVSDCIVVDQNSVFVHKNMRVAGKEGMCYTRPVVGFKFVNGSELFAGQLGPRNEIMLSTSQVEFCQHSCEHYFQAGNQMYKYKNYYYDSTLNLTDIPTLHTMMTLNLSLVENIDFKVIELYSKTEKRLSNVFDIETMFREYNYYTQNLNGLRKDLDDSIDHGRDSFIQTLGDIMQDLGTIGKVVVNVASGVFSLFGSIVSGVISFFKNPFGGMLLIVLIIAGVVVVYLFMTRSRSIYSAPIRMLYPGVERAAQEPGAHPVSEDQIRNILMGMHQFQQRQRAEEEARREEERQGKRTLFELIRDSASNVLRRRRGGGGYQRLQHQHGSDDEGDYEPLRRPDGGYDDVDVEAGTADTGV